MSVSTLEGGGGKVWGLVSDDGNDGGSLTSTLEVGRCKEEKERGREREGERYICKHMFKIIE